MKVVLTWEEREQNWELRFQCKQLHNAGLKKNWTVSDAQATAVQTMEKLVTLITSRSLYISNNPHPNFLNCMQNEVTSVRRCRTSFHKKSNCLLLLLARFLRSKKEQ